MPSTKNPPEKGTELFGGAIYLSSYFVGRKEFCNIKCTCGEVFDRRAKDAKYNDLSAAFGDDQTLALKHFIEYGYNEGRTDTLTDSSSDSNSY